MCFDFYFTVMAMNNYIFNWKCGGVESETLVEGDQLETLVKTSIEEDQIDRNMVCAKNKNIYEMNVF